MEELNKFPKVTDTISDVNVEPNSGSGQEVYTYKDLDATYCPSCNRYSLVRDCIQDTYRYRYIENSINYNELHQIVKCRRCTALVTVYGMKELVTNGSEA